MDEPFILIVGAADTGRAPITVALLRRLAAQRGLNWRIESAGVVGHDDDPAEPEARDALLILGLDLSAHRARSLTDELAEAARVIVTVDRGVARVVRARRPGASIAALGELAGRERDIPDPFRMQVGAWVQYAREIEALLEAGFPRLQTLVMGETPVEEGRASSAAADERPARSSDLAAPLASTAPEPRLAAVGRISRLLDLSAEMPGVINWAGARRQIEADLGVMEQPFTPDDLARPYVAVLRAMLGLCPEIPAADRCAALRAAVARLRAPIASGDLETLSRELAAFT
ncbi:MAG: low molecular weight phosphatase family protein [Oscillochloridaceae bacterium]|nr:low molecular weight phosphatase family protein [Chloroflexaceae bacterium]MDW8391395.1 low molecular weight phosphatase family protein [Oscillochloridaceae bacterium]